MAMPASPVLWAISSGSAWMHVTALTVQRRYAQREPAAIPSLGGTLRMTDSLVPFCPPADADADAGQRIRACLEVLP
jgi:hypothetical protein